MRKVPGSGLHTTETGSISPRRWRLGSRNSSAPTSPWCSTSASPFPRRSRTSYEPWSAPCGGASGPWRRTVGPIKRSSGSSRVGPTQCCAVPAPGQLSISTCPVRNRRPIGRGEARRAACRARGHRCRAPYGQGPLRHGSGGPFGCARGRRFGSRPLRLRLADPARPPREDPHPRRRLSPQGGPVRHRRGPTPSECGCATCRVHSPRLPAPSPRDGELLAHSLLTVHNLHYTMQLIAAARLAIEKHRFDEHRAEVAARRLSPHPPAE